VDLIVAAQHPLGLFHPAVHDPLADMGAADAVGIAGNTLNPINHQDFEAHLCSPLAQQSKIALAVTAERVVPADHHRAHAEAFEQEIHHEAARRNGGKRMRKGDAQQYVDAGLGD